RCIRPFLLWENDSLRNLMQNARQECANDGAHFPVIKNDKDNDAFNRIVNTFDQIKGWNVFLVMDLVCNGWSNVLEWRDGSSVKYTPYPGVDLDFDCTKSTVISRAKHDDWQVVSMDVNYSYTVLCVMDPK
ncbi:hypothetical protein PMAYCL1PPCAC_21427, partial [Pristionchus mayeri]